MDGSQTDIFVVIVGSITNYEGSRTFEDNRWIVFGGGPLSFFIFLIHIYSWINLIYTSE